MALPRPLVVAAKLLVTGVVTWLILRAVGLQLADLRSLDLSGLSPRWLEITASVILLLLAFAVSALLWGGIAKALGGVGIGPKRALAIVLISNLGRYLPGKVFQLVGLAWLGRRSGLSGAVAAAAAVLGQALHLVAALVVGGSLFYGSGVLPPGWDGLVVAIAVAAVVFLSWKGAVQFIMDRVPGHPAKWEAEEMAPLPRRSFLPWVVGYLANWLVLGIAFYLLARGLGVQVPLTLAISAFAAAYLLGYAALFAPAGLGVREGFLVAFLGPALGPGPALALAAAQRVWMTGAELIGAALAWPALDLPGGLTRPPVSGVTSPSVSGSTSPSVSGSTPPAAP